MGRSLFCVGWLGARLEMCSGRIFWRGPSGWGHTTHAEGNTGVGVWVFVPLGVYSAAALDAIQRRYAPMCSVPLDMNGRSGRLCTATLPCAQRAHYFQKGAAALPHGSAVQGCYEAIREGRVPQVTSRLQDWSHKISAANAHRTSSTAST